MAKRILSVVFVLGALVLISGSDCSNPCEEYCQLEADCIDDVYGGDWAYTGYADSEEYYEECVDLLMIPGGPAVQRAEQNACRLLIEEFDEDYCY